MEFKSKRKYTAFFLCALLLHIFIIAFWLFFPSSVFDNASQKTTIVILSIINTELILFFYLEVVRKKYLAYYDKVIIKRSLLKNINLTYNQIEKIVEKPNDTLLLWFGNRPSFKVYYIDNGKRKKTTIRTNNNDLLLKVLNNETKIANR